MTWKIVVGNPVWWMVIAIGFVLAVLIYCLLYKKNREQKRKVLLYTGCVILLLFYVQRFFMLRCDEYVAAYGSGWKHIVTELLPFNLCYLSVLLMLLGAYLRNEYLLGFCFYVSFVGAVLALAAPVEIFTDISLLLPAVALFYLLHVLLAAVYFNIGLLGFTKINLKTGVVSVLMLGAITFLVHLVNLLGRTLGIDNMNYFYTFDAEGSAILEQFWEWLPVPYLYLLLPAGVIFLVWALLVTLIYRLVMFLGKKVKASEQL